MRESSPPADAVAVDAAAPDAGQDAVVLLPECTARNAEALRAALLECLEEPGKVDVAVGAVERVDTACLQLLCAFVRERTKHGKATVLRGRNDALMQAVALLGLGGTLTFSDLA